MRRRSLAWVLVAIVAATGAAVACTTFDDATVPASADASLDAPTTATDDAGDAAPDAGTRGYLTVADAARACAKTFSCSELASSVLTSIAVPLDRTNFAACVDWLATPLPPNRAGVAVQAQIFRCIAAAATCGDALACLPIENLDPNDPRCSGPDASAERCAEDAGTVMRCKDQYALHCGSAYYAPGSACMTGVDGTHWCALGTNCAATTSCIGTLLDYCGNGSNLHESVNCAAAGYRCDIDPEAGAPDCLSDTSILRCANPGPDCLGTSVAVCDGYQQSIFDCAALGAACDKKNGPARCARPTDTCSPYDASVNACDGSSIALCIGGAPASFDCARIGLACKPAAGAQSAHCG